MLTLCLTDDLKYDGHWNNVGIPENWRKKMNQALSPYKVSNFISFILLNTVYIYIGIIIILFLRTRVLRDLALMNVV